MDVVYTGRRVNGTAYAHKEVDGTRAALALRLDLANHSPTGFEWGYPGSGPAQLALAIMADMLNDDAEALRLHQPFKFAYIASLRREGEWRLTADEIRGWIDGYRVRHPAT